MWGQLSANPPKAPQTLPGNPLGPCRGQHTRSPVPTTKPAGLKRVNFIIPDSLSVEKDRFLNSIPTSSCTLFRTFSKYLSLWVSIGLHPSTSPKMTGEGNHIGPGITRLHPETPRSKSSNDASEAQAHNSENRKESHFLLSLRHTLTLFQRTLWITLQISLFNRGVKHSVKKSGMLMGNATKICI